MTDDKKPATCEHCGEQFCYCPDRHREPKPASPEGKTWRTWCLEPDFEGREGDPDEIYWGYALNYDPQQGPLNIQANRVMVIEHAALLEAEARANAAERRYKELSASPSDFQIIEDLESVKLAEVNGVVMRIEDKLRLDLDASQRECDAARAEVERLEEKFEREQELLDNCSVNYETGQSKCDRYRAALEEIKELWPDGKYTQAAMIAYNVLNTTGEGE